MSVQSQHKQFPLGPIMFSDSDTDIHSGLQNVLHIRVRLDNCIFLQLVISKA